jgi:hypothetical protein
MKQKAADIMKRQLPSQTLEEQFLNPSTRKAPLSESIRLVAQSCHNRTPGRTQDHLKDSASHAIGGLRDGTNSSSLILVER